MMLLLDNTVLSNFAIIHQTELLRKAVGDTAVTVPQVINEFEVGIELDRLPHTDLSWLRMVQLNPEEVAYFNRFTVRLNAGEAACLAVAMGRNGRVFTDDRDARKLAANLRIPISGTIGILIRLMDLGELTIAEANNYLAEMINLGYRAPIQDLGEL